MEKKRFKHLDCIRGLAVLWVVVHHISLNYGVIKYGVCSEGLTIFKILSFFMIPFYVISGYFFDAKKSLQFYTINKVKKLLIPYMTFSIFGLLIFEVYSFIGKGVLALPSMGNFIATAALRSNTPCWFFISLFCVNVIYYFISKRMNIQKHLIIGFCFFLAFLTYNKTQIFGYGNILLGLVYFHVGTLFRQYETFVRKKITIGLALAIYLLITLFDPQWLSFVLNFQICGNYILNLLFSVFAMIICWNIALLWKYDGFVGRNICFIGRNSLVLFASHRPILNYLIQPTLSRLSPDMGYLPFLLISFIALLLAFVILNWAGRKFVPFLLGA